MGMEEELEREYQAASLESGFQDQLEKEYKASQPEPKPEPGPLSRIGQSMKEGAIQTAKDVGVIASNPWSIAEATTSLLTKTPAFAAGSLRSIQEGAKTLVAGGDLEDVWDNMVSGFHDYFSKTEDIIPSYDPSDVKGAEAAAKIYMTPFLASQALSEDIATPLEKEHPNLAAATRMAGVVAGFAAQGGLHQAMKPGSAKPTFPRDLLDSDVPLDTTYAKKLVADRTNMEKVNVPGRPLARLSNIEKSLAADRETVPGPRVRQAAETFEKSDPYQTMTPAEKSAWAMENQFNENVTPQAREGLLDRMGKLNYNKQLEQLAERMEKERLVREQAKSLGEEVGPKTPTRDLPENRKPVYGEFPTDDVLKVAAKDPEGNLYVGNKGDVHATLFDKAGLLDSKYNYTDMKDGWVNKNGNFLTQKQAQDYLKKQTGIEDKFGVNAERYNDFLSGKEDSYFSLSDEQRKVRRNNLLNLNQDIVLEPKPKVAPAPVRKAPSGEMEVKGFLVPESTLRSMDKRRAADIFRDINTSLGSRGSVSGSLTPEQAAARARLVKDLDAIKRNAARTGKTVKDYMIDLGTDPAVVDSLLGSKPSMPITTPQQVADSHNLIYNGMQEFPPEMNYPPLFMWTDKATGSTFTSKSLEPVEVKTKLQNMQAKFGGDQPSGPTAKPPRSRPDLVAPDSSVTLEQLVADAQRQLAESQAAEGKGHPISVPSPAPVAPIESVVSSMESSPASTSFLGKLVRTKEGLSEALNSPEVVYRRDKSGVGNEIYRTLDHSDQRGNAFLWEQGEEFSGAIKGVKEGGKSDLKIGQALDGKISRSDLSLSERKSYDFFRGKFDYLLDRFIQNSASSDAQYKKIIRYAGKPEAADKKWVASLTGPDKFAWELANRKVSDYLPHIFDRESILLEFKNERALLSSKLRTAVDPGKRARYERRIAKIDSAINTMAGGDLVRYDALPTSLRMRFFEPRKGKEGYNLSAIRAYRAYLNGIKRKIYDEPAVRRVAELHKSLDPSLREYNKWYVRRYLGWDKNKLDDLAGAISSFQWMRTLGLNPRSAVVNLTQRINTIADAGLKFSLRAQKEAFTKEGQEAFDATGLAREIPQVLMEGPAPAGMEKVRAIVGYLFNKVELGNRKHAFLAGRAKALASGSSPEAAVQAGIDLVHKTQFRYGKVGMPKALSHPVGRIGLQFWSYPIKQTELIVDWAKNDPKKLIAYVAMAEGGKVALQKFLNVDLSSALGFGVNIGQAIKAIRDVPDEDWRGFFRHLKVAASEGGGLLPSGLGPTASGLLKVIEGAQKGVGMQALGKELTPILVDRTVQAYKAVIKRNNKNMYPMYSKNGDLMYYLTGKQLLMRSVGPKSYTETEKYTGWKEDQLLDQDLKSILRDTTRAIVDGDNKKANMLINKYGVIPSEQGIANEVLRRELPYEERRVINKTRRQEEFESMMEGENR